MTEVQAFLLPDLGEGLTEASIAKWHVANGEEIVLNQIIVEVETEKAVVELPSPYAGTVSELMAAEGETVKVGSPIITVSVDQPSDQAEAQTEEKVAVLVGYGPSAPSASRRRRSARHVQTNERTQGLISPVKDETPNVPGRPLAKPPVRYLARQKGIELNDLQGTGPDGTITRQDVLRHEAEVSPVASHRTGSANGVATNSQDREIRVPITGVRKRTAAAMVRSAFTAPHVTEFITVDVTPTVELVERLRASSDLEGIRITPLTLVAKALLLALKNSPSLNSSWDEEHQEIVTKHFVNLGIAAATPRGLLVPNIKGAELLSLKDLSLAINALTRAAREGHSTLADLTAGTITITNIGVFGIDAGTPILNPGEAAILCFGSIRRQPWEYRGEIALRSVTTLSLSFDHRLVDGSEGSLFLSDIAQTLADPTYLIARS